uniref:Uncharacterized protein n=1 Tax=Rhizophora mucronata TaxID=61149 RepID=A0A2P2QR77_RHIMU
MSPCRLCLSGLQIIISLQFGTINHRVIACCLYSLADLWSNTILLYFLFLLFADLLPLLFAIAISW